jgi:hypothetical protein
MTNMFSAIQAVALDGGASSACVFKDGATGTTRVSHPATHGPSGRLVGNYIAFMRQRFVS